MRFHVVGAGAIGGLTGAFLAKHGEDVHFVDIAPEHVARMNESGLLIDGVADEFRVGAPASLPDQLEELLDVVLLGVKSQHTMTAIEGILPFMGPDTLVVSLQNGLNPDRIAEQIGRERVAGAFINFAADYLEPGHIRYGGVGDYYIGMLDGRTSERINLIAEKLGRFMNTVVTSNVIGYLWSKECYGSLLIGTALVDAPVHEVLSVPENREVLTTAITEVATVASALGIRLEKFEPFDPGLFQNSPDRQELDAFYDRVASRFENRIKQYSGIWRDLRIRRRKTEVPWLIGEVVSRGQDLQIDMPINSRLVAMIEEIENGTRPQAWENLLELHELAKQPGN